MGAFWRFRSLSLGEGGALGVFRHQVLSLGFRVWGVGFKV